MRWLSATSSPAVERHARSSGSASATSSSARLDASGLCNSCEASATKRRCRSADASRRSSIAFIVVASRPISSSVPGCGTRRSRSFAVISRDLAPHRLDRAARRGRPRTSRSPATDEQEQPGRPDEQEPANGRVLSSTSSRWRRRRSCAGRRGADLRPRDDAVRRRAHLRRYRHLLGADLDVVTRSAGSVRSDAGRRGSRSPRRRGRRRRRPARSSRRWSPRRSRRDSESPRRWARRRPAGRSPRGVVHVRSRLRRITTTSDDRRRRGPRPATTTHAAAVARPDTREARRGTYPPSGSSR